MKGDTTDVTFGEFGTSSSIERRLEAALDATGDDPDDSIKEPTRFLGKALDEQMPASANDGVLFVVNAEADSGQIGDSPRNVVIVLKLDTEEDRRIVLDQDSGEIRGIDEDAAFPPVDQLQKGAVFPKEGIPPTEVSGDIKIYQSSPSEYFKEFFDLSTRRPSSIDQGRNVLEYMTDEIREKTTRDIRSDDISTLVSNAEDNDGTIDDEVLAETLSELTESEYDAADIENDMNDKGYSSLSLGADNLPQMIKHTVIGGSDEITVKYHSSDKDSVEIERSEEEVEIRVEGVSEDISWVDR